jgi:Nif-specific regulatory protein
MIEEDQQKERQEPEPRRLALQLDSLWEISQSLLQHLNIDDLIRDIIERITLLMQVEAMSIALYDDRKKEFVFRWSSDIPERDGTVRFPADQGIAGSVFRAGRAEVISDVAADPRHYKKVDEVTGLETKSMIAVPLKTKAKSIGVLEVLNKGSGSFDAADLNLLVTLAPIIAMALDNARMYTELDRAYKDLQVIDKGKDELIRQTRDQVALLHRKIEKDCRFDQIVGNSAPMIEVLQLCERVIDSDITVLIEGETGTGKELIARTIHYNGPRRNRPFVTQNCGGIPDTLLASELFGHRKGAFTGAFSNKKGLFEICHGGTVFLDEVTDMPGAMQTSLLRVLQEGEIRPLGSDQIKTVDVRVISATNRSLEEQVKKGQFREDLFYRLSVFTMKLPPLRERIGDIPILASHFVKKVNKKRKKSIQGLSPEAMKSLSAYPFPGNVRELENEIERAVAMAGERKTIELYDLSAKLSGRARSNFHGFKFQGTLKEMVTNLEASVVAETLKKHHGNKTKTAKELGLSRYGLTKKIQRYGL